MPITSMELKWARIGIVKAVKENLASRARRSAAQKKALIRNAEIMQRRMNNSSGIYRHVYESALVDPVY